MSAPDVVGDTDWVALAADVVAGRTPGMPSGPVSYTHLTLPTSDLV